MKINKEWHAKNLMPKSPNLSQKMQWHVDHARECGCRPIPEGIKTKLRERKPKLIVAVLAKNKDKYLLAKEVLEGGKTWWVVPGGKVEFGETIENAAKRELLEETGIEAKELKYVCFKEALSPQYNYHTVIFFYLTETNETDLKPDIEGKVIEAKWFTKDELNDLPLVYSAKWLFQEYRAQI